MVDNPEPPEETPNPPPALPEAPEEVPNMPEETPDMPSEIPEPPDEAVHSNERLQNSKDEKDPVEEASRLLDMAEMTHRLEWRWASFDLYVITPAIPTITPPVVIPPEPLEDGKGLEFVYSIHDYGFKLGTSKADEMWSAGMSMCKLYYTIEKMIYLLVERLKSGGISTDTEVQVAFSGFTLAQRKAFEVIINLNYNVVVTNFEPGEWGEEYLQTIKRLADKGYGYPPGAPRDMFRHEAKDTGMRKST